jgi:uncharacterized protein
MPETKPAPRSYAQVWTFLAIVFPLSWALWIPVMLDKTNPVFLNLSGGPALAAIWLAASRDSRTRNPARALAFVVLVPLCWIVVILNVAANSNPPAPLQFNPGLLLPSAISAWIVSGAFSADTGVRGLLRGLVAPQDWRGPAVALLITPALLLASALVGRSLGLPVAHPEAGLTAGHFAAAQWTGLAAIRFFHYVLFTAVFEEPGWRGFLLPRLQSRHSPLMASVLVWLPWAVWHLPLDLTRPGGWSLRIFIQQRVVVLLIFSIVITWLYNRSRGGLLSAVVFHGATGSFLYVLPSSAPAMVPLAVVLMVVAVIAGRMWRRPSKTPEGAAERTTASAT